MAQKFKVLNFGILPYSIAYDLQIRLLKKRMQNEICDTLIFCEHPSVITLGKRADETHLKVSESFLQKKGCMIIKTDRGGEATWHGPGQIVGYLIINLKELGYGIERFVTGIEEVFIKLLKENFKIKAERIPSYRGVWIDNSKILALGLAVKSGITMHGFAFNVTNSLEPYSWIIPCGITDKKVTNLSQFVKRLPSISEIKEMIIKEFVTVFGYELHYREKNKPYIKIYNSEKRDTEEILKSERLNKLCVTAR